MRSTEELVEAARQCDPIAIAALVERYQRAAVTTAWAITKDFHQAQDVAQDCFVAAFRHLGSLQVNRAFGRWLMTSIRRAALRSKRRNSRQVEGFHGDMAEVVPEWLEPFADTLLWIDRLPSHEQEVIRLRYLSELPLGEIAEITGRPIGTVSKQISRALVRLRSFAFETRS